MTASLKENRSLRLRWTILATIVIRTPRQEAHGFSCVEECRAREAFLFIWA